MRPASDYDIDSLAAELARLGHKASHARRALRAFYSANGQPDWEHLDLGKALASHFQAASQQASRVMDRHDSRDGTTKLLIEFHSGGSAETVLMPTARPGIMAGCVSSQIGCAMGCDFCASTKNGLERDLSAGEIVEQFLHLRRLATVTGQRLRTIVFMGMGEPMLNLDNVIPAIRRIAGNDLGALGWRQITVSTVGIVPGIERLAAENLNVQLALSLHAPDDETRSRIVPANRKWNVAEVMNAAKRYARRSPAIVNIEYCLIAGVNDSLSQARQLAELMRGFRAHVNLIPYNAIGVAISGATYRRPADDAIQQFLVILRDAGVVAHVRVTRGDDVSAACGQLRQLTVAAAE